VSKTEKDWDFTNYVHDILAVPIIYQKMEWTNVMRDENADRDHGIDYFVTQKDGMVIGIQERFRDNYYSKYNDFTIRYRRDRNQYDDRHESEFYKIKAKYLIYGITNGKKFIDARGTLTNFLKYAIIDLGILNKKIEIGRIVIPNGLHRVSKIQSDILIAAHNFNPDGSSDFIAFDVLMLDKLFGDEGIITYQEGFF
jgi:hypothetical protein